MGCAGGGRDRARRTSARRQQSPGIQARGPWNHEQHARLVLSAPMPAALSPPLPGPGAVVHRGQLLAAPCPPTSASGEVPAEAATAADRPDQLIPGVLRSSPGLLAGHCAAGQRHPLWFGIGRAAVAADPSEAASFSSCHLPACKAGVRCESAGLAGREAGSACTAASPTPGPAGCSKRPAALGGATDRAGAVPRRVPPEFLRASALERPMRLAFANGSAISRREGLAPWGAEAPFPGPISDRCIWWSLIAETPARPIPGRSAAVRPRRRASGCQHPIGPWPDDQTGGASSAVGRSEVAP